MKERKKIPWLELGIPVIVLISYIGIVALFGRVMKTSVQAQLMGNLTTILLGLLFWFKVQYNNHRQNHQREKFSPKPWARFVLVCICMLFAIVIPFVGHGLQLFVKDGGQQVYQSTVQQDAGWFLIMSVFVAPISEEIVFRWLMYKPWKKVFGVVPTMFLTSLIFALMHGTLQHLPVTFFVGLTDCVLIELTGYVRYAMLNHFIYNLMVTGFTPAVLPADTSYLYRLPVLMVVYLACLVVLYLMYRYRKSIREYVTTPHLIDKWNRPFDENEDMK